MTIIGFANRTDMTADIVANAGTKAMSLPLVAASGSTEAASEAFPDLRELPVRLAGFTTMVSTNGMAPTCSTGQPGQARDQRVSMPPVFDDCRHRPDHGQL